MCPRPPKVPEEPQAPEPEEERATMEAMRMDLAYGEDLKG